MEGKKLKSLSDFNEEIHRCSKCGLCQAVCPVFQSTGNECTVSRGQFIMLDGVVNGKLKLSGHINKYLDLCLKCNKCSDFCPSEIDIIDVLLCAKHEYFKNSLEGKLYGFLESKWVFDTLLNITGFFTNLFSRHNKSQKFDTKAVYFGGCVSKLSPDINNYVTKLLNKMKIEVINTNLNCCGMPFLTTGNIDRFVENLEENISKLPDNIDLIITDCSSCEWAWGQYHKYLKDENLKSKLSKIKFKNIYSLIAENEIEFSAKNKEKLTFHNPCHESHSDDIEKLIKHINNTEYTELSGKNECCGFAGLEHPHTLKTLYPLYKSKRNDIRKSNADFLLTTCVGCLLNLSLITLGTKQKAKRLIGCHH